MPRATAGFSYEKLAELLLDTLIKASAQPEIQPSRGARSCKKNLREIHKTDTIAAFDSQI
jgi:hypothetical protein